MNRRLLPIILAFLCVGCIAFGVFALTNNGAPKNAEYTTEYYFENVNDDNFSLDSTKTTTISHKVGENVNAETLSVDGFVFDENNTLNVKSGEVDYKNPLTLKLYYKRKTATVSSSVNDGLTYTGSQAGVFKFGQTVNLTGTVTNGTFAGWTTDGNGVITNADSLSATYIIAKEDCDKTIAFTGNMKYLQTVECGANGTITPSEDFFLNFGESKAITVSANEGYEIDSFKINGVNAELTNGSYTLSSATSTNTISVTFKEQVPASYKVEYYLENINGTYRLEESDNKTGRVGATAEIEEKIFTNYEEDLTHTDRVVSGVISEDGNLVLKRYYKLKTFTLSFVSSNGSGEMQSQTLKVGESITLPANAFTKDEYKFIGWATTENGEVVYTDKQTLEMGAQNITLYAVWAEDKEEEATISFAQSSITKIFGDAPFTNALTNTGDGVVTYSTNSSCVTVNNAGLVTIVGVGTATITATVSDTANYIYPTKTAEFTLTVNANTNGTVEVAQKVSKTYDGSEQTINASDLTVTLNGNVVTNFTISGKTSETNAGNYEITVTISSGEYTGSTKDAVWTIDKAQGTISFAQSSITKTFGDAPFTNALTNTGDGVVTYSTNSSCVTVNNAGLVTIVNVGTATITAAVADSANCTYAVKTATFTIVVNSNTSGEIAVAQKNTKTYNGSLVTVSKADFTVMLNGNEITDYTLSGTTSGINAGEYTAKVVINSGEFAGSEKDFTWTIDKAQGVISFAQSSITKTYGDANFTNALTNTGDGVVTYSSSSANVAVNNAGLVTINEVGTATITATVADTANYTYAVKTATYVVTINANTNGEVEVTQKNAKTYTGSLITLNQSDLTVTLNGAILTDYTISGTTSAVNADEYQITITVSSGNYAGSKVDSTWIIDKKQATISFAQANITKTYGDANFTNTLTNTGDGVVTYSSSSANVAVNNAGLITINGVGTATITATVVDSANCAYAVKTATYVITVNANTNGKITVTQKNTKTYTGTTIELSKADLTVTLNGLQATNYTLTGTTSGVNAGEYEVTITINSGNYVGSKTTFDWIIGKKQATISFAQANITKTYGDANFTNTLTNTGDGVVTYKSSTNNVTVSSAGLVAIVGAGTATITATVTDSANYTYTNKTATYTVTVNPKQLDAPTNVTVSTDGEISWNAVDNAETYEVGIDELSYWSNVGKGLSYNFKNAITEKTGIRTIYVRAKGRENYATSENASKQVVVYALSLDKTTGVESVSGAGNYIEGASASISASVKAYYTFTGWTGTENINSNENVILMTSSKTLTANTQAINYNITWEKEDATWVKEPIATYNIETNLITLPERDDASRYGYALTGWKVGETNYDLGESVTFANLTNNAYGNITITALWKEVNFNITFTAYFGNTDTKFIDWDIYSLQGVVYINNENIDVSDKYSIAFGDPISINSIREIIDFKVNALSSSSWNPQKADYVVMYYNGKNITGKTVELSEDTNIEIRFYKDGEGPGQYAEVTIMLDSNLGVIASHVDWTGTTNSVTKTIESNTAIGELPTVTREGYEFIGWFTEKTIGTGTQITETTTFTTNTTLYAHFTKYITITFDAGADGTISPAPNGEWEGSGRYATKKVKVGETFGVIPEDNYLSYALKGYRDLGWWTSPYQSLGETVSSYQIVTFDSDTTIYAKWTNEVYVAFYVYDDESGDFKIYGYSNNTTTGRTIVFPGDEKEEYYFPGCNKDPERVGYKFLGWYDAKTGGNKVEKGSKVPYDAELSYRLYAHWEEVECIVTLSLLNYENDNWGYLIGETYGYTKIDDVTVNKKYLQGDMLGQMPILDPSERRSEYFVGWFTSDGIEVTNTSKVFENVTYYAKFGRKVVITLEVRSNQRLSDISGWENDGLGNYYGTFYKYVIPGTTVTLPTCYNAGTGAYTTTWYGNDGNRIEEYDGIVEPWTDITFECDI